MTKTAVHADIHRSEHDREKPHFIRSLPYSLNAALDHACTNRPPGGGRPRQGGEGRIGGTRKEARTASRSALELSKRPISRSETVLQKTGTRTTYDKHRERVQLNGWILTRYPSSEPAAALAHAVLSCVDKHTKRLFFHLIVCTDHNLWEEGWTPVGSRLIRRDIRGASWKTLAAIRYKNQPLIDHTDYRYVEERSREFRVCEAFMSDYRVLLPETYDQTHSTKKVDLFTGRLWRGRMKTRLTDENDHYYGKAGSPLREAMLYYKEMTSYLWKDHVERHLDARRRLWEDAYEAWKNSGDPVHTAAYEAYLDAYNGTTEDVEYYCRNYEGDRHTPTFSDYHKKYLQYRNDLSCYRAVLHQGMEPAPEIAEGVFKFRPAYRAQMAGRVGCIGGMLQSCSREMKHAAFHSIPGLRNYDLTASHPTILLQKFEEAIAEGARGIDPTWLRDYVNDPKAKHAYARLTALSEDTWKGCFMATIMGATLPKDPMKSKGDLVKILREEVGAAGLEAAYERLEQALRPLKDAIDAWHAYLVGPYLDRHGYNSGGGRVISNEAGKTFAPDAIKYLHERKAKLAAFVLQGLEAAFIHSLTVLGGAYGYEVIQNEHDGVITLGEIPEEAVARAAHRVGLQTARLVEKPFCESPLVDDYGNKDREGYPLRLVASDEGESRSLPARAA